MKKVLYAVLGVAVAVLAGSQLIPATWSVTRSTVISAPPKVIYPFVADWKNWEKWSAFKMPGATYEHSGKPSGVGAVCVAKSKDMEVHNEIVKADPATGVTYKCRVKGFNDADCTIAFSPDTDGTKVEFTYLGTNSRNPLHRLMSLMGDKMLGEPLAAGLANLKKVAEEKAAKK